MANPDEIVGIVDEDDKVLYQAVKKDAHEKGLLHRTTIGQLKDSQGRWILVKQSPDKQDAGRYVCPVGGHVQAGETEDVALKREAEEECGLSGFEYKLINKKIYNRNVLNRQENHYFIYYEIYSDEKITLNEESVGYQLFTDQEMKDTLRNTPEYFGLSFHFVVSAFYPELLK
jgi:8-oxo-dGTP pyrophosphatase MutT (NUDIX family)